MNKNKILLITYLIELNILLDLFLINNINVTNKIKDIIILCNNLNKNYNHSNLLNYNKKDLKKFIDINLKNLLYNI